MVMLDRWVDCEGVLRDVVLEGSDGAIGVERIAAGSDG